MLKPTACFPCRSRHVLDPDRARQLIRDHFVALQQLSAQL
jgi:hypothetical protein